MTDDHAGEKITVMVNGMPGPMAYEVAVACLDRGFELLPIAFTGPSSEGKELEVKGRASCATVKLVGGPGVAESAEESLKLLKETYPNMVVIDYTHPSAVLNNLKAYVRANIDFIMGTTGGDDTAMMDVFDKGTNRAVIAPNMAKQIVALQAALQAAASRFPSAYKGYKLSVTESHQSTKADTSGTAKAVVESLIALNGDVSFTLDDVVKLRDSANQLAFGVPDNALRGHAFHTYRLHSPDGSVAMELQHNVCGRRVYAEGTADAVAFLASSRRTMPHRRLFDMIDVLENGEMT